MSDLLNTLGTLFNFLFTQMGNIAGFFTTNLLGQLILGVVIFGLIIELLIKVIKK